VRGFGLAAFCGGVSDMIKAKTTLHFTSVTPQGWGLKPAAEQTHPNRLATLGLDAADLENRAKQNTYLWLMQQYNAEIGAFHGYYDPRNKSLNEPQTVNLIAPFQLLAAFDRYQDQMLLDRARACCDWMYKTYVDSHPMSFVLGGVRDNIKPRELWTKYTADYVLQCLSLFVRTNDSEYFDRARDSAKFLRQAQHHNFSCKYDHDKDAWIERGWQSFGRVAHALSAMAEVTQDQVWLDWAIQWGDRALELQWGDGGFYLINDTYYNSDIAADEIRALIHLHRLTKREKFLKAGLRYADWHVERQRSDGAWWLSVDRYGLTVNEYVGPGDIPNIAIAMLMAHRETGKVMYFKSAARALLYSLSKQALPGSDAPYLDDPRVPWGFWSWDPYYDYTMSADQSTHHVRAYWFFLDYFFSLNDEVQAHLTAKPVKVETLAGELPRDEVSVAHSNTSLESIAAGGV
jgi:hypothetical protein